MASQILRGGSGNLVNMANPGTLELNDPNKPLDPSGHYVQPKTIGGSGRATAGGVTWEPGSIPGSAVMRGGRGEGGGGGGAAYDPFAAGRRIGNPGGRMAPASPNALQANGRPEAGSLTGFYASRTTDPVTGLPLNPSSMDQFNARAQNERGQLYQDGRDDNGNLAPGAGVAGFQRQGAMDDYYRGRENLDPFMAERARNGLIGMNAQSKAPEIPVAPDPAFPTDAAKYGLGGDVNFRAKGGPVGQVHPYLVGEKGPEVYVPNNGQPQVVGMTGPKVLTFPDEGQIIPNNKIKPRAGGGNVEGGREIGQSMFAASRSGLPRSNAINYGSDFAGAMPNDPYSGVANGADPAFDLGPSMFGSGFVQQPNMNPAPFHPYAPDVPFQQPVPEVPAPVAPGPYGLAYQGLMGNLRAGLTALGSRGHYTPPEQSIPQAGMAALHEPENYGPFSYSSTVRGRPPNPMDFYNPAMPYMPLAMSNRTPVAEIPEPVAPVAPAPAPVPVAPQLTDKSFQSKYGSGSVTFGPKKAATFYDDATKRNLPASEYFQRAANRQGANRYAKPEAGYHPEKLAKQDAANERAFKLKLPTKRV